MKLTKQLMAAALAVFGLGAAPAAQAAQKLELYVLSSRPDMISGGDALIEVDAPSGTYIRGLTLTLNGKDVTNKLKQDIAGARFRALLTGLKDGDNTLAVKLDSAIAKGSAKLKLVNHPLTGPILSGPHLTPYECRTVESGLGEALDADCSVATRFDYFYRAADNTFKPLADPKGPRPTDLVMTTTNTSKIVPYIVRVESGTINRTIYRIAILDDPKAGDPNKWMPGGGWNQRLGVVFGGGAGANYNQGSNTVTSVLNDLYLARGFAFMNATELVNGLHGNAVLQGETLMMLKEHFIETYGLPIWTVGTGGSGGAIQQLVITEIYPGLLDGLQPSASFPDSTLHTADCGLLQNYWKNADAKVWTTAKKEAVQGFALNTCASWERSFVPVGKATNKAGCGLKNEALIYDPVTNPKGARCAIQEMRFAIYGRDPKTGFTRKTVDNVGMQYGLGGLNSGAISVDEFLDLNEKIGGEDVDGNYVSARTIGDEAALRAVYSSGLLNGGGGGLATVPILHTRSYTDMISDIHSRERDLTVRARLIKANGDADNEAIWVGPARPMTPPPAAGAPTPAAPAPSPGANLAALSLDAMTKWLDALAADTAPLTHKKVVAHKPAEAVDAYFDTNGVKTAEVASWDNSTAFNKMYPVHLEPRIVAGQSPADDILKCQLKQIRWSDYKAAFTVEQQARMKAIFPAGVCDYSKPGVGQVKLKGTYQKY